MNSTVSRLAIRREGKGGRQTGEGLTVFRCGLPAYIAHADKNNENISFEFNESQTAEFTKSKSAKAKARSNAPNVKVSDIFGHACKPCHVPHLAEEYRLIRRFGPIDKKATIFRLLRSPQFCQNDRKRYKTGRPNKPCIYVRAHATKMRDFDSV